MNQKKQEKKQDIINNIFPNGKIYQFNFKKLMIKKQQRFFHD